MNPINTGLLVTSERNWHDHNTKRNDQVSAVQHPFKSPNPRLHTSKNHTTARVTTTTSTATTTTTTNNNGVQKELTTTKNELELKKHEKCVIL